MTEASVNELVDPNRLANHFKGHGTTSLGDRWDKLWEEKYTPWDRGQSNPALLELLEEKPDILGPSWRVDPDGEKRRKTALVPGCGRGYDVLLLSAFGYDTYGLEVSPLALEAAKAQEKAHGQDDLYKERTENGKGKITWVSGDFFKDEYTRHISSNGTFDVLFDYTFLSALPPSLRPAWSQRLKQLLDPTGKLICVEWPSQKDPKTGGPPWGLPPSIYLAHLQRPGKELEYSGEGVLLEDKLGPVADDGLERILHYHPDKTHPAGMSDGQVMDFVGVWAHKSLP